MSDASVIRLADAMVGVITAAQVAPKKLSQAVPAVRLCRPVTDLDAFPATPAAIVVPFPGSTWTRLGGGRSPVFQGDVDIELVLQQKIDAKGDLEAVAAGLLLLCEELVDLFKPIGLPVGSPPAILTGYDAAPAYSVEALLQKRCFVASQVLTWRMYR